MWRRPSDAQRRSDTHMAGVAARGEGEWQGTRGRSAAMRPALSPADTMQSIPRPPFCASQPHDAHVPAMNTRGLELMT